jgi:hypothetical protein
VVWRVGILISVIHSDKIKAWDQLTALGFFVLGRKHAAFSVSAWHEPGARKPRQRGRLRLTLSGFHFGDRRFQRISSLFKARHATKVILNVGDSLTRCGEIQERRIGLATGDAEHGRPLTQNLTKSYRCQFSRKKEANRQVAIKRFFTDVFSQNETGKEASSAIEVEASFTA